MQLSMGRWKVNRNQALAQRLKHVCNQLSASKRLRWVWVKGHSGNIGNVAADAFATRGRGGELLFLPTSLTGVPAKRLRGKQAEVPALPVSQRRRRGKQPVLPLPDVKDVPSPDLSWEALSEALVVNAEMVVGRTQHNGLWSPYTAADKSRLALLDAEVQQCYDKVRLSQDRPGQVLELAAFKEAKRRRADFRKHCRKRWLKQVLQQLTAAVDCHDMRTFYDLLRRLGVSTLEASREGSVNFSLSSLRAQAMKAAGLVDDISPDLIDRVVPDLGLDPSLGAPPTFQEVLQALYGLKDSSAGSDEVTIGMLRAAGDTAHWQLFLMIRLMWRTPHAEWSDLSKEGIAVALYKGEGSRQDLDNFRFVVMLSAISRVLARLVATRLSAWAERRQLLPQVQFGFRRGHSTADALFIARVLTELAAEVRLHGHDDEADMLVLVLVDITKAYTSVQRSGAWRLLRRLGVPEPMISVLMGLHEGTVYRCRSRQGLSEPYRQQTGFREGCCTSPILYNIFHSFAVRDFEQRCAARLQLQYIPERPFNIRMHKHPARGEQALLKELLLLLFADDTTLLTRMSRYADQEQLLGDTLSEWKEYLKPAKTKRLAVGYAPASVESPFQGSVKLLGSLLSHDASYQAEDDRRLQAAKLLWRSVHRQLPRFGLSGRQKGAVVGCTVVRCLTYGTESRVVRQSTLRKWQVFLHQVARGLTGQRIMTMQEDQVTSADLLRKVGLDHIEVYVGVGQLRYLGHLARLPDDRLEKQMLYAWLTPEHKETARKMLTTRQQLWSRLRELMLANDVEDWHQRWTSIAQQEGGSTWNSMVNQWVRHQRQVLFKQTWQQKHHPEAMAAKQKAAEDRAFRLTGGTPVEGGKYACPHCFEPKVCRFLRSLKLHVATCKDLPEEVRRRQAATRAAFQAASAPMRVKGKQAPLEPSVPAAKAAASSTERRPEARQCLQPAQLVPDVPQPPPLAEPPARVRKSRRSDDWNPTELRAAYKKRYPLRQMSLTDLPAPGIPEGHDLKCCVFCKKTFATTDKCSNHSRACPDMPYDEWLRRIRITQYDFRDSSSTCPHCGTGLSTPKARGRHGVTCGQRRTRAGLSLHSGEFHDIDGAIA